MPVWQDFLGYLKRLVMLEEQTAKNTTDIKELRQELKELTKSFNEFKFEVLLQMQKQRDEQENLLLRLENQLLRYERRLPLPPQEKED